MRFNRQDWSYDAGVDHMIQHGFDVLVSATDDEIDAARGWYPVAHVHAAEVGEAAGFGVGSGSTPDAVWVGAGVIAALSPGIMWAVNVREALRIATGDLWGEFAAYGSNLAKAAAIVRTGQVSRHLGGPKSRAFAMAMAFPHSSSRAVVDRHIWRALNVEHGWQNRDVYRAADEAVEFLADKIGEDKHATQALLWLKQRGRA